MHSEPFTTVHNDAPEGACVHCADEALQAEYDRHVRAILGELAHHLRDPIVMAAVSAAVSVNGGLPGSLDVAVRLCLDAADKLREVREVSAL